MTNVVDADALLRWVALQKRIPGHAQYKLAMDDVEITIRGAMQALAAPGEAQGQETVHLNYNDREGACLLPLPETDTLSEDPEEVTCLPCLRQALLAATESGPSKVPDQNFSSSKPLPPVPPPAPPEAAPREGTEDDEARTQPEATNARLLEIALNLQWMARRYADGRRSYAVGLLNQCTRMLVEDFGLVIQPDPIAGTIYARDGDRAAALPPSAARETLIINVDDLESFARSIADGARSSLDAAYPGWRHLPSFREAVVAEATRIMKLIVRNERLQASAPADPPSQHERPETT